MIVDNIQAVNQNKLFYSDLKPAPSSTGLLHAREVFAYSEFTQTSEQEISITTNKFGKQLRRNLQFAMGVEKTLQQPEQTDQLCGYLVHKYVSIEEENYIKSCVEQNLNFKVFVLAHRLFDFALVLEKLSQLGIPSERFTLVCLETRSKSLIYSEPELKRQLFLSSTNYEKLVLSRPFKKHARVVESMESTEITILPFFIINFFTALLNPLEQFKNSHFLWLNRLYELFAFLGFQKTIFKPALFRLRHSSLMTGYKSYGFFVDSFNFILSTKVVFIKTYYFMRHILLMSVFKSYGLAVDLFYAVDRIIRASYYPVRHAILMSIFKSYGFILDVIYFIRRFVLSYLLYPFFKIYWFSQFQYQQRILKKL